VNSVAVSPDGRRAVSASDDRTVSVWDLQSGTRTHLLTGHQGPVRSAAFSPDGRRVVSASEDQTVAVWDLQSGHRLATVTLDGKIMSLALHGDGRVLVTGDEAGNVYCLEYGEL
jgi:WD40 repeat protein